MLLSMKYNICHPGLLKLWNLPVHNFFYIFGQNQVKNANRERKKKVAKGEYSIKIMQRQITLLVIC